MNWEILTKNSEIEIGSYVLIGEVTGGILILHIGLWYQPIISDELNLVKILCRDGYGLNYKEFPLDKGVKYSLIGNKEEIITSLI